MMLSSCRSILVRRICQSFSHCLCFQSSTMLQLPVKVEKVILDSFVSELFLLWYRSTTIALETENGDRGQALFQWIQLTPSATNHDARRAPGPRFAEKILLRLFCMIWASFWCCASAVRFLLCFCGGAVVWCTSP